MRLRKEKNKKQQKKRRSKKAKGTFPWKKGFSL